jgi:hypothetical protein
MLLVLPVKEPVLLFWILRVLNYFNRPTARMYVDIYVDIFNLQYAL